MNKEDIIVQINKIYQALNAISVQSYSNIKTLGNCLDAMQQLAKDVETYEKDIQDAIQKQMEQLMQEQIGTMAEPAEDSGVVPVNPSKPKPKRIKESGEKVGKD